MASIVSDADDYVREVAEALQAAGLRAEADTRNEKINYKVREHSVGKVPVILAVGQREEVEAQRLAAPAGREGDARAAAPTRRSPSSPPRRCRPTCGDGPP